MVETIGVPCVLHPQPKADVQDRNAGTGIVGDEGVAITGESTERCMDTLVVSLVILIAIAPERDTHQAMLVGVTIDM